jgi:CheY-like chemotaxis protein
MTILVIEDSRFLRSALEKMLVKAGHRVVAVGNGREGLQKAQETYPDVIVLDMMLPALEGTEVLRHLKRNPLTQPIPVIVLSSLSQRNEEKLKMAAAAAYFEKSKLNLEEDGGVLVEAVERARADHIEPPGAVV